MPGTARIKSASNIYHIMLRGNNRQEIFRCTDDYSKFHALLKEKQKQDAFVLYAWCLMPNHVHLLLKERSEPIAKPLQSIAVSYAIWHNRKYRQTGHLFQGRYRSRPVEDQTYFLRVVRYIHRNPLDAGLCERMEDYPFSSYWSFFRSDKYKADDLIFQLIRKDEFEQYHLVKDEFDDIGDIDKSGSPADEEILRLMQQCGISSAKAENRFLPREKKVEVIWMLLEEGASYRQISRLTGFGLSTIRAAAKTLYQ